MLKLGASLPWKEVIEVMTGKPEMDTAAFREYFRPLEDWLKEENRRNGVRVGWEVKDYEKFCKSNGAMENKHTFMTIMVLMFMAFMFR